MERKRHLWPWIAGSVILLPVLYVLSFIPIFFLRHHAVCFTTGSPSERAAIAYAMPIGYIESHGPRWATKAITVYGGFLEKAFPDPPAARP